MENPCELCLVQSCCTDVCDEKLQFIDFSIYKLREMGTKHIYTEEGFRKSNVPKTIKEQHEELVSICKKNSEETNLIMNRYVDRLVPR